MRTRGRSVRGRPARALIVLVAVLALSGCAVGAAAGPSGASSAVGRLTVFAASSLTAALTRAASVYEASHPGAAIDFSFGASNTLATQIAQGAPADAFFSADTTNPDALATAGLVAGSPEPFAGNRLTVIVPTANPAGIQSPADLARSGVKVIAAGEGVPITTYANRAIANLGAQPGYPSGFASAVAANVVSREDNVKAVVAKIELGEGDAAIVYVTDARASVKVATIDIPAAANVPATYAAVALKASSRAGTAAAFVSWVASPAGQAVLATFGFLPPP